MLVVVSLIGGPLLIAAGIVIFVSTVALGALCYAALWWGPKRSLRVERNRYLRYIDGLRQQLGSAARQQRDTASWSHPGPDQLLDLARTTQRRFERRPGDADYGQIRIGLGTVDLALRVRDEPETNPLASCDPIAGAAAADLRDRPRELPDMPVTVDLDAGITAVVGKPEATREVARSIVCRTATFHDPAEVRLAFARHADNVAAWEWVKWLPHADLVTDRVSEVANLLADQVAARLARRRGRERPAGAIGSERLPRLVVIVDADQLPVHDLDFRSHGVGLLDLDIHLIHLVATDVDAPRQVDQRIRVRPAGAEIERGGQRQAFRPDALPGPLALMVARQLAARAPHGAADRGLETGWLPALRDIDPAMDEDALWQQRMADATSLCKPFTTYQRKQPSLLRRIQTSRRAVPTADPYSRRWTSPASPISAGLPTDPDARPAASAEAG